MSRPVRSSTRVFIPLLLTIFIVACQLTPKPAAPTALPPTRPPVASVATDRPLAATASVNQASPSPKPTLEHIIKGPFNQFTPGMGLPSGDLNDLWAAPDGQVWLAASSGVYSGTQGLWQLRLNQRAEQIIGADAKGRVWVLFDHGGRIGYNDAAGWHLFDKTEGWLPLGDLQYLSPGFQSPPATDKLDQVWFATGRDDLRRFESKTGTWKIFTAADLGYKPPEEEGYQGHFLTAAVTSSAGKVWVADCIGQGEMFTGQGVRRLDGDTWNPAPPTAGECVMTMAADSQDRIWVGALNKVLRYDPVTGNWDKFPLPEGRSALVTSLVIDRQDNPWIEISRAGGASMFGSVQRLHLSAGQWVLDDDPGMYAPGTFAFDTESSGWICASGQVTKVGAVGAPMPFGTLNTTACRIAFDDSGQGWMLARGGPDSGLWFFKP